MAWSETCIYITCNCEFNWFYLRWHGLNHAYILPVTVSSTVFIWGGMVWTMHIYYLLLWVQLVLFEVAWSELCIYITRNGEFNCFYLRWHGLNHAYILPVTVSSTSFVWGGMVWTMHIYYLLLWVQLVLFEVAWSKPCIYITCYCEFNCFYLRWHGLKHAYILPVTVSSTSFVWGGMVWNMHIYYL